mmetsp:Transcript_29564/g.87923  ORF Transcript_29564/g.87923 Transcript_29564/m.87923 type:complete len:266 (+) Transcript_29564:1065-1862(+)
MPTASAPTISFEAFCAADRKAWQSGLQYDSASIVSDCTSSLAWQVVSKRSPSKRATFVSKKALAAVSNAATLSAYGSVDWSLTLSLFGVLNLRVAPHLKASAPCSPKMLKPDWIIDSIWSFVVLGRTFSSIAFKFFVRPSNSVSHCCSFAPSVSKCFCFSASMMGHWMFFTLSESTMPSVKRLQIRVPPQIVFASLVSLRPSRTVSSAASSRARRSWTSRRAATLWPMVRTMRTRADELRRAGAGGVMAGAGDYADRKQLRSRGS